MLRAEKNRPHTNDATDSTAATMPVERVRYHHQEVMGRMIPVVREVRVSLR